MLALGCAEDAHRGTGWLCPPRGGGAAGKAASEGASGAAGRGRPAGGAVGSGGGDALARLGQCGERSP